MRAGVRPWRTGAWIPAVLLLLAPWSAGRPGGQSEAPPPDDKAETYQLRLPGKPWAAAVAIPGFEIEGGRARPDGSQASVFAASESSGIILSMFLEQEEKPFTAAACRDKYFTKVIKEGLRKTRVKQWTRGELALGQYLVVDADGIELRQMNVNAYLGKDDVCVDLHLSKVMFKEADRALFETIIDSLRIVPAD